MVTHVVGDALLHTEQIHGWTLTTLEYADGIVSVDRRARLTQVVVGDRSPTDPAGRESYAAAACTVDGELLVAVRSAPPAIVARRDGCRTRPADGATSDSTFPSCGERLILLSCTAFEAVPDLLVEGIRTAPERLAEGDAERLLVDLFGQVGRGAGAVIDYTGAGGTP